MSYEVFYHYFVKLSIKWIKFSLVFWYWKHTAEICKIALEIRVLIYILDSVVISDLVMKVFIPSNEFIAYLKQIKVILSTVKKYRIFSLMTNKIYIFSLWQTGAVSTILVLISFRKALECTVFV